MQTKILPVIPGSKVSSWTPKTHFSRTDTLSYMILWVGGGGGGVQKNIKIYYVYRKYLAI